jgi:hypothetical protein
MRTMAEQTTGAIYVSAIPRIQPPAAAPANDLQGQIVPLRKEVRGLRRLVLWTLIFTAILLVAVVAAAVGLGYPDLPTWR